MQYFHVHAVAFSTMEIRFSKTSSGVDLAVKMSRFTCCLCTYDLFLCSRFGCFDVHFIFDLSSQVSLELSFMEAVQGSTKTLTFQTHVACEPCGMVIIFTNQVFPIYSAVSLLEALFKNFSCYALFGW